ncbi:GFA family protein [Paracoccus suum]|uniref:GFA family protein n=1 Tax=Paracoccus suum TaxID=2259340 RepID=UPI001F5434A5|nr:hypothetical protein [Paracoccus suum]
MATQTYTGSCQCGSIAYEVEADLDKTIVCNCSRCRRLGAVLTFATPDKFQLTADGPTTDWRSTLMPSTTCFARSAGSRPTPVARRQMETR